MFDLTFNFASARAAFSPLKIEVVGYVVGVVNQLQVVERVIRSVVVFVVDGLMPLKFAANGLLHQGSMLKHIPMPSADVDVAIEAKDAPAFPVLTLWPRLPFTQVSVILLVLRGVAESAIFGKSQAMCCTKVGMGNEGSKGLFAELAGNRIVHATKYNRSYHFV